MSNLKRRVVVTGIGAVTPLGNNASSTWQNIIAGQSGIDKITIFDPSESPCQIAAEVKYGSEPHLFNPDSSALLANVIF